MTAVAESYCSEQSTDTAPSGLAHGLAVVVGGAGIVRGHGFLVVAARLASTEVAAFMIRHSTGFLQVALPAERCQRLRIPPLNPFDSAGERMCVGVDVSRGTGTGISAADRAATARALADPTSAPDDFKRPGHVVVVAVERDSVRARPTPARLALELVERAGPTAGALFAELVGVGDPTRMITQPECLDFAETNRLQFVTVD